MTWMSASTPSVVYCCNGIMMFCQLALWLPSSDWSMTLNTSPSPCRLVGGQRGLCDRLAGSLRPHSEVLLVQWDPEGLWPAPGPDKVGNHFLFLPLQRLCRRLFYLTEEEERGRRVEGKGKERGRSLRGAEDEDMAEETLSEAFNPPLLPRIN